jgi:tetratricopeptide (TPR) repeat protein
MQESHSREIVMHDLLWQHASIVFRLLLFVVLAVVRGGHCLGEEPPAKPAASDANTFDDIAKDIEKSVLALGYPRSTANDLVRLVRDWKCETWKQRLVKARSAGNTAEVVRVEEEVTKGLVATIGKEITTCREEDNDKYFYLPKVVKDKKAQCLGYSQLVYLLGRSVGLRVNVIAVLELASGDMQVDVSHVACITALSDNHVMMVDLTRSFVSKPFVLSEAYHQSDNYLKLRQASSPLGIDRRIQIWDDSGACGAIYHNLGAAYAKAGDRRQSLSCFTKAITLNPKYAYTYIGRGNVYQDLGRHNEALADYTKAIELDPSYADAHCGRGVMFAISGQLNIAMSEFTKAIELNPKLAGAYYNRGNTFGKLRQLTEALSDYTKAIELDSKFADAYCNRGLTFARADRPIDAISDLTKAIELNPKYAVAYRNRGVVNAQIGKMDDARADLRKAVELDPQLRSQIKKASDEFKLGL